MLEKFKETCRELREYDQIMFEKALRACDYAEEREKLRVRQLVAAAVQATRKGAITMNGYTLQGNKDYRNRRGGINMIRVADKTEHEPKQRLHMRGVRTPQIFVMLLGRLHRREEKLRVRNESLSSPYLEKKQKDFSAYCSEMYKLTAHLLKDRRVKENDLIVKVNTLTARLTALMDIFPVQTAEAVQEKRRRARLCREISECRAELSRFTQELEEMRIAIAESELETREIILEQKSRAEALIVVYLDGGGYPVEGRAFELSGDEPAEELYRQYFGGREQPEQIEEKEVEAYVNRDI